MYEIYISFILGSITTLLGVFIAHFFSERRNRRKEFNQAATEFRASFLHELRLLKRFALGDSDNTTSNILDEAINKHEIAILKFRAHLNRSDVIKFNRAWQDYACDNGTPPEPNPNKYCAYNDTFKEKEMREKAMEKIKILLSFANFK